MNIMDALQELRHHHASTTKLMTPSGQVVSLYGAWLDELSDLIDGKEDPNSYTAQPDGIHYVTFDGKDGGIVYAIK